MFDNGASLIVIAQLLGHDTLDITAHYAQVSTRLMMQTYNAAHPHARAPEPKRPVKTERPTVDLRKEAK